MVDAYPIVFIDESQDTHRAIVQALLPLAEHAPDRLTMGLFGDTMQRIYPEGHAALEQSVPTTWAKPEKNTNWRSGKRIVDLGNAIRREVDSHTQVAHEGADMGFVRLFVSSADTCAPAMTEAHVSEQMADICGDPDWQDAGAVKRLTLEHRMAAHRLGFPDLYECLYSVERLRTGLLDGTLPNETFFSKRVVPLIESRLARDETQIVNHLRRFSHLMDRAHLREASDHQQVLSDAAVAIEELCATVEDSGDCRLRDLVEITARTSLLPIPSDLRASLDIDSGNEALRADDDLSSEEFELEAWRRFLEVPLSQLREYREYVEGRSPFDTHQGVKGREFPRVMVVMSDTEQRGFSFSYEKLFGVEPLSPAEQTKLDAGEETRLDQTRRLLYVTCTRAERSLALVAYTRNPTALANAAVGRGWLERDEIIYL